MNPLSLVTLLVLSASACVQPQADAERHQPAAGNSAEEDRVRGEYLVRLVAGSDPAAVRERFSDYGVTQWRRIRKDTYLVHLQSDPGPGAMTQVARDTASVRSVEPNRIYTTQ